MKSFPKKCSLDISFNHVLHTQNVKPQFCFIIIFVAHVQGIKIKGRQAFELEEAKQPLHSRKVSTDCETT